MKKLIIGCIGMLLLSNAAFSQGIEGKGVKAGLTIATLRGKDVSDAKSKIGGVVGGYLVYRINEKIVIQPELLFVMKGAKREVTFGSPSTTVKWTESLNYIEIPALVKFSIPAQGNIKPSVYAGPALAIKISAKSKAGSTEKDIKDLIKSTDIGLVIGGDVEIPVSTTKLTIDARYTLGLTKIDDSAAKHDVKNGVISLMVGYPF